MKTIKKLKSRKKATTHIEIVLSFTIFVGFVFFILVIFNPIKFAKKDAINIEEVERKIENYLSTEVISITLKPKNPPLPTADCFSFDSSGYPTTKIFVKNEQDNTLNAKNDLTLTKIYIEHEGSTFFYLYFSDEFEETSFSPGNCQEITKVDYNLGLFMNLSMISNKTLQDFQDNYKNNYKAFKEEIGVPAIDFSLVIKDNQNNPLLEVSNKKLSKIEVYAKDTPVQIVYSNRSFEYGIMHLEAW